MKYLDFTTLLDGEPPSLALLSTFRLDPDFFESRLLRCSMLAKARRIAVFMDHWQWLSMLRQDMPARLLNRRYLVIPTQPPRGVFHPKLNLFVRSNGGLVQCGSNNLTRAGCSRNLELLNSFAFAADDANPNPIGLARSAFEFFEHACDDADAETARIARKWLSEERKVTPWLNTTLPAEKDNELRLVHTYDGSLWDRVVNLWAERPPRRVMIISPYYDLDGGLIRRLNQHWPQCKIELVVQQDTTSLALPPIKGLRRFISLSELKDSSRPLHAKLLAWESTGGGGCLVGSANFTSAAFDARNVEACILVLDSGGSVDKLFDKQFNKRPIAFEDFTPGSEREPAQTTDDTPALRVIAAVVTENGDLRVSYKHGLTVTPTSLKLAIRTPGEKHPRTFIPLPNREYSTTTVSLSEEVLTNSRGTMLASLVADVEGKSQEGPPMWVVQEARLTFEPAEGSSSSSSVVEDTGEGLNEFLDELGKRDGIAAVVEYLRHMNIRFFDGGGRQGVHRRFRLRIRDPFQPDWAPDWLLHSQAESSTLAEAINDFVERHEWYRLRRHAKRGNINGMENFLDIFVALVRLLYVYHVRGIVLRGMFIGPVIQLLEIALCGFERSEDACEGYLCKVSEVLGDTAYIQEVMNDLNFLGHLWAALVIAQKVRFTPGEKATNATRPRECLVHVREMIVKTTSELGLKAPAKKDIMTALDEYHVFSPEQIAALEKELGQ